MAKRHCAKHKRYVHNCVPCQSEALRETVGFPKTEGEVQPPDPEGPLPKGAPGPDFKSEGEVQTEPEGYAEGAPGPDAEEEDEEGGDIAEWEPEVENDPDPDPEPATLPSYTPSPENACDEHPEGCPEPGTEGSHTPADPALVPGEGEPDIPDGTPNLATQMNPLEVAMFMFPRRLIPEGATEVCDEERPDEPYMASYEELIKRAVAGYLETGLTPEDAVIVVAAEVIKAEQLGEGEATEALTEEELEAFDAGLEASPELTGCIEDYNNGFNAGMAVVISTLRGYYAGDEDAVAFALLRWLESQAAGMKK